MNDNDIRRVFSVSYSRALELMPTKQQNEILGILRKATEPVRVPSIAAQVGTSLSHANVQLFRLLNAGYVVRYQHTQLTGGIEYHYEIAKDD